MNTHELQLTRAGTAYLWAYQPVRLPGFSTPVMDVVLQEIDLETRDVLFEWHSLDHVPPSASYQVQPPARGTWDYFHGNSIDPPVARRGTIVVSARNTSAVYGIDRRTGAVRWTLGGKQDEFGLVRYRPFLQFCAQHDARRQPNGDITIFDNGGPALGNMLDCPIHKARVLRFRLDLRRRKAHLTRTIRSEPSSEDGAGHYVWAMGNAQRQGNGDMLISWGTTGRLTRVTPSGRVTLGVYLERYTYRAVRGAWTGPADRSAGNRGTAPPATPGHALGELERGDGDPPLACARRPAAGRARRPRDVPLPRARDQDAHRDGRSVRGGRRARRLRSARSGAPRSCAFLDIFLYRHMIAVVARAATTADAFNAVAEPRRRQILDVLAGGERPVNDLVQLLGLAQPQVSKHLRVLREVGAVDVRDEGRRRLYRLNGHALKPIHDWVKNYERAWTERFDELDVVLEDLKRKDQGDVGDDE